MRYVLWTACLRCVTQCVRPANVCQILSHLRPDDLLHISRVSKSFHQLLTSRRTAWIWRRTWSNVGDDIAPPLPEDISDVLAWKVLVFGGTGCQVSTIYFSPCHSTLCHLKILLVDVWLRRYSGNRLGSPYPGLFAMHYQKVSQTI